MEMNEYWLKIVYSLNVERMKSMIDLATRENKGNLTIGIDMVQEIEEVTYQVSLLELASFFFVDFDLVKKCFSYFTDEDLKLDLYYCNSEFIGMNKLIEKINIIDYLILKGKVNIHGALLANIGCYDSRVSNYILKKTNENYELYLDYSLSYLSNGDKDKQNAILEIVDFIIKRNLIEKEKLFEILYAHIFSLVFYSKFKTAEHLILIYELDINDVLKHGLNFENQDINLFDDDSLQDDFKCIEWFLRNGADGSIINAKFESVEECGFKTKIHELLKLFDTTLKL